MDGFTCVKLSSRFYTLNKPLSEVNWGHFVGIQTCLWKTVMLENISNRFFFAKAIIGESTTIILFFNDSQTRKNSVCLWLIRTDVIGWYMYSSGWFVLEFKSSVARATNWAHALCLLLPLWKYLRSVFDPRKEIIALLTTFQG